MQLSALLITGLAAFAAALPGEPASKRQCAGCEPSGKGSSGATGGDSDVDTAANASANNTNYNTNNISLLVPDEGGKGGNGGNGGGSNPGGEQGAGGFKPGSCQACISFCETDRSPFEQAICFVIVCGVDCVIL